MIMKASIKEGKAIILMAVYNGEKYLSKQLDSIINQSFTNWELIICDDNSDDNTKVIVDNYMSRESRIIEFISNEGQIHGAYANYFFLMRYVKERYDTYSYYFYCDQDDIWNSNKMLKQIQCIDNIKMEKGDSPILVYSDLDLIDGEGKKIGKKMSDIKSLDLSGKEYSIFFNPAFVWGTTMAHNGKLWELLYLPCKESNMTSHDNYVSFYAVMYGTIFYMDEVLVLYRRHGGNVSPLQRKYNIWSATKKILTGMKKVIDNHSRNLWNIIYFIDLAPYKTEDMKILENTIFSGGLAALKYLKKHGVVYTNKYNMVALKLILLFRIHLCTKYFQTMGIDQE